MCPVKRIMKPSLTPNYLLTCCSQTMLSLTWSSHCLWWQWMAAWVMAVWVIMLLFFSFCCSQSLTICQRSLTTMQIQIQGLLQFSVPFFPTAEVSGRLTDYYAGLWKSVYHSLLSLIPCYTEGPFGDPATVELHWVQCTPANSLARLPWATQGKVRFRPGHFLIGPLCSVAQSHLEDRLDWFSTLSVCTSQRLTCLYTPLPVHSVSARQPLFTNPSFSHSND